MVFMEKSVPLKSLITASKNTASLHSTSETSSNSSISTIKELVFSALGIHTLIVAVFIFSSFLSYALST